MDVLDKTFETIKGQIENFGQWNPNKTIFDHLQNTDPPKAKRFADYRARWEEMNTTTKIPDIPLHMGFAFQDSCNLKCPHCYRQYNDTKNDRNMLEVDEIKKLIDECKDIGVPSIELGNGIETYMYPKIDEVIDYIGKKDFEDFWMSSNGIPFTEKRAEALFESNCTRMRISIDAANPQTYAKSRGGNYYTLIKNIFTFLEKRERRKVKLPILRVSLVKFNITENDAEDFVRFWKPIADEVDVQSFIDVENVNLLQYNKIEKEKIFCKYPSNMLWIDWQGDYRPCCSDYSKLIKLGNIKDMSIKEAWKCKKIDEIRRQLNKDGELNRVCVNCLNAFDCKTQVQPLNV